MGYMDDNIGVGLIVGGVIASSIYVYQSDKFSKAQKAFLLICIIFPPLQWISILILLGINNYKEQNSPETKRQEEIDRKKYNLDDKIHVLSELREKGLLTDEEYYRKLKKLKESKYDFEITLSEDYKILKRLLDDDVLTEQEFNTKIGVLKDRYRVSGNQNTIREEDREIYQYQENLEVIKSPKWLNITVIIFVFIAFIIVSYWVFTS